MNTPALIASVDELLATFAADARSRGPLLPLATLIARLREPPRDAGFWARVGDAMIRNGFAEPAAGVLAAGLQVHPRSVELLYLRANAQRVAQRYEEAEADFRAALDLAPGHRQAALSLAFMLREHGRIDAAAGVIVASWQHNVGDPDQTLALLEFLRDAGAAKQAHAISASAHERWPDHARIAAIDGELKLAFGDFTSAHVTLRRALQLDPRQSSPWLRLSYCQRYTQADDPDRSLFESARDNMQLPASARACAGFALGKLYDDIGDCQRATQVLRDANELAKSDSPWSSDRWRTLIEQQLACAALPSLDADPGFVPVFIVGLPRTGTTLVATRLALDPSVRDRGELNWIAAMYAHASGQNALSDRSALQSLANVVRTMMRRDDAAGRCYIDKNPLNFRYLNLILALFPNARIIHCRRCARDTALSLWSQHFAHSELGFSYDFDSIALVAADHERLMAHWRSTLSASILDVDYEALVSDPSTQLARVAAFVGLGIAATGQDPSAAPTNVVTTASVWQARQPVYTQAVGRWRRYAEFLPELTTLFAADA